MDAISAGATFPVRMYQSIGSSPAREALLAKFRVYLPDQPGSLAGFASAIAKCGANIAFFHYDRSLHSNRVAVEVQMEQREMIDALVRSLDEYRYVSEDTVPPRDEIQITMLENILEIKVRLANEPGTLAAFACLLKEHDANVIYMLYDEDIDTGSACIALATRSPGEIDILLNALNRSGYYYRVIYRGTDEQEVAHIIGLKMVEKFFLRLKRVLTGSDAEEIRSLVESSRDLYMDLVHFSAEAGSDLEAGDVFEKVLALASRSRGRTGERFSAVEMPPLQLAGSVTLYSFRLPTSENIYVFHHEGEVTFIDAGHGVYFEDIKQLLRERGMDPARVRRMFITHPDTDHVGTAGYFERDFGTEVFMHPDSREVIRSLNRSYGSSGRLLNLNKYYTRLSSAFTACRFPEHLHSFSTEERGTIGKFRCIDSFFIGPLLFDVFESHGGHAPGQVFYLNRGQGLLFTSDFLLNIRSLSPEEREHLSLYRYLLTNPNSNSAVYREETAALREIVAALDGELRPLGRFTRILPGHGDYYRGAGGGG